MQIFYSGKVACPILTKSYAGIKKAPTMMNCFCKMVSQRNVLNLISSKDHCQIFSSLQISDTQPAGLKPTYNLISGFGEWTCAVIIITTPWRYKDNIWIFDIRWFIENNSIRAFSCQHYQSYGWFWQIAP